jgi:hypothetical protein
LNPRPPGPQPGALPTELPPPRLMKDSFEADKEPGAGRALCAGLAVRGGQYEEQGAERHRQTGEPDRGKLDATWPSRRLDRHWSRRRFKGEEDASHPGDLRRRDQDELGTERACQRGRGGDIHEQARFLAFRAREASLERVMRVRGLEPPRALAHRDLNPARMPVPPHPLACSRIERTG